VAKTNFGKLIGGFSPLKWNHPSKDAYEYITDKSKNTFLFSLNLGEKYSITNEKYAICHANNMGPIFGAGSDFEIVDYPNKNENNHSGIGKSFNYKGSRDDFYGGKKYLIEDYECYEVVL
jgi:hypothetical protein